MIEIMVRKTTAKSLPYNNYPKFHQLDLVCCNCKSIFLFTIYIMLMVSKHETIFCYEICKVKCTYCQKLLLVYFYAIFYVVHQSSRIRQDCKCLGRFFWISKNHVLICQSNSWIVLMVEIQVEFGPRLGLFCRTNCKPCFFIHCHILVVYWFYGFSYTALYIYIYFFQYAKKISQKASQLIIR